MGKILEINGPLVKLQLSDAVLGEQVRVGKIGLVGEVIGRDGDTALAQLYEDTAGLRPGEVAEGLGWPLSVELGPGLLNAIFDGVQRPRWPVRAPRPVHARLPADEPLVTGQRILDTLFPVARGGKARDPRRLRHRQDGAAGSAGQVAATPTSSSTSAAANAATRWPACSTNSRTLTDPRSGRALMERTVIIANTSNMPVAAREASIYCAVTVAEYFRDQGLHVALMADSTSRWAEALREVSGRFGELPGEGGYPAYLSSPPGRLLRARGAASRRSPATRLGDHDRRHQPAGRRLLGARHQPHQALRRAFWASTASVRRRASTRPCTRCSPTPKTRALRALVGGAGQCRLAGQRGAAGAAGRAGAPGAHGAHHRQGRAAARAAAHAAGAELVNEALLRQSAFSPVDRYCAPARQAAMLRLLALRRRWRRRRWRAAPRRGHRRAALLRRLQRMGEDIGEDELARFAELQAAAGARARRPSGRLGSPHATAAEGSGRPRARRAAAVPAPHARWWRWAMRSRSRGRDGRRAPGPRRGARRRHHRHRGAGEHQGLALDGTRRALPRRAAEFGAGAGAAGARLQRRRPGHRRRPAGRRARAGGASTACR
jgi:hypothetical protein